MISLLARILSPYHDLSIIIGLILMMLDPHSKIIQIEGKENSEKILLELKEISQFPIPKNSVGIQYKYFPPIDPMFFAKLQIDESGELEIKKNAEKIEFYKHFPEDFGNSRCPWWSFDRKNLIFFKKGIFLDRYVEIYIVKEDSKIILYLKQFVM